MTGPDRSGERGALDRIVTRLAVVTVVAGIAAAALGAALVGAQARTALRDEVVQRNATQASVLAIRMDTRIESIVSTLVVTSRQAEITALDDSSGTALRSLLTASAVFDEVVLYDQDGAAVAAAAERFLPALSDYEDRPEMLDAVANGPSVRLVGDFPPLLEIGVPVETPPGNIRGVLLARTPLEIVATPLEQLDPTSDATRMMTDAEGRILVHPSRDLIAEGARFEGISFSEDRPQQAFITRDGVEWMVASAPMTTFDGVVIVEQDAAEALGPVTNQLIALILIVIAVTLASVLAVSITARRLIQPLRPISAAIERLGSGEHGVRLDVPSGGELSDLANRVNDMAESLDRRQDELTHMHHLSRMVISGADRPTVSKEVVEGARTLLSPTSSLLFELGDEGHPTLTARTGEPAEESEALSTVVGRCADNGTASTGQLSDGTTTVAVPIAGIDHEVIAVLAVILDSGEPSPEELELLETFASFAGVAFENVYRLELEHELVHELQQTIDARYDLTQNVTHDLRVPLAAITGFASRLREEWAAEPAHREELLNRIEGQAAELDEMILKLLEFGTPETGRQPLVMAPTPLRASVRSALDALAPTIQSRPVENMVPNWYVMGDHVALTRTLVHLLSNAVKWSPLSTPVRIEAASEGSLVRVEVIDQGVGIAAEDTSRIFQPFWRKRASVGANENHGTGLGLTLAAEYVAAMGGEIGVESEPDKGSTFFFTLPAADPVSEP